MLMECPRCDAKVDAKFLAERVYSPTEEREPHRTVFLECPACHECLVAEQEIFQGGYGESEYSSATRLWPEPTDSLHLSIPKLTSQSLLEAKRCFGAKAYAACAVMCGRAIEAICAADATKAKLLGPGLKELLDKKVIDQRLFEWGNALREQRNIGAHANEKIVSREDARDVLDFALAICEYVFVLSEKYEAFQARQKGKASIKVPSRAIAPAPTAAPPANP
jgi:hypothetical protein